MPSIITNNFRVQSGDAFQNSLDKLPTYIYLGGLEEWEDEPLPPSVVDSTQGHIDALKDVQGMKRVYPIDVISVIPRIDWIEDAVYDQYNPRANLIDDKHPETDTFYKFYVVTDEFNVYKCISNNNRAKSTVKPSGTITESFTTPDGYKWKYMYTVRSTDAFRFMTPNWIPCYTLYTDDDSSQWEVQQSAVKGSIEHIQATVGGSDYSVDNPPTVTVEGDGTGCEAYAVVDELTNEVASINVSEAGSGYTRATVSIVDSGDGAGAEAEAYVSPLQGHGYDARIELGGVYKMFRIVLDGTEGDKLPVDIKYRRTGMLVEPKSFTSGLELYVANADLFSVGDTVSGVSSNASGVITSINRTKNCLYIKDVVGTFDVEENVATPKYETILDYIIQSDNLPLNQFVISASEYMPYSGEIMNITAREQITRSVQQLEEIRLVVSY